MSKIGQVPQWLSGGTGQCPWPVAAAVGVSNATVFDIAMSRGGKGRLVASPRPVRRQPAGLVVSTTGIATASAQQYPAGAGLRAVASRAQSPGRRCARDVHRGLLSVSSRSASRSSRERSQNWNQP